MKNSVVNRFKIGLRALAVLVGVSMLFGIGTVPEASATAGNWVLVNSARTDILAGTIKTGDSYKLMLVTNSGNVSASSTTCSGVTGEVGTSNTGYTTGGAAITPTVSGTTSVIWYFSSNPTWTAGSSNLTAKWAVICDTTAGKVLAYATLDSGGADVTTTSGQTLTISNTSGSPVFTFA